MKKPLTYQELYRQYQISQSEVLETIERMKKPDINLDGYCTLEYRLGEIRGYNQALEDLANSLSNNKS